MKSNRFLVIGIISTLVVCLVGVMVFLIVEISQFTIEPQLVEELSEVPEPAIKEVQLTFDGVVTEIDGNKLIITNVDNHEPIELNIVGSSSISDKYNKQIPLSQIVLGEIVDVSYKINSHDIVSLQIHPMAFMHHNIANTQIDTKSQTVSIGTKKYHIDELAIFQNPNQEILSDLSNLTEFDEILIKGLEDDIYSLNIINGLGYIQVTNLPSENGRLEINRQRQIPLNTLPDNTVKVQAGTYNLALYLENYLPIIVEDAIIEYGQTYILDAANIQPITYDVAIKIVNNNQPYNLSIDNISYGETRNFQLPRGTYTLDITSAGFYDYSHEFKVQDDMAFQFILSAVPPPPPPLPPAPEPIIEPTPEPIVESNLDAELLLDVAPIPVPDAVSAALDTSGPQIVIEPLLQPSTPAPIEPQISIEPDFELTESVEPEYNHIINLNTNPPNASVYLNGVYIGVTPVSKNLDTGIYKVEFSLEGYENYSTSIIVEEEDIQTDYLYVLAPK
ncbi:PEGA domain-containing protein [Candidatus Epulonipiscium viviparus]|uniref:PEGA domain-containing protein n=1 Tax=Candidatus Epulonipiscium viviparus TaxID=420336 RepID=UPI0004967D10|nr:PEGA domain-containing protein [Candidatus Epulopiscium viviparus]